MTVLFCCQYMYIEDHDRKCENISLSVIEDIWHYIAVIFFISLIFATDKGYSI